MDIGLLTIVASGSSLLILLLIDKSAYNSSKQEEQIYINGIPELVEYVATRFSRLCSIVFSYRQDSIWDVSASLRTIREHIGQCCSSDSKLLTGSCNTDAFRPLPLITEADDEDDNVP